LERSTGVSPVCVGVLLGSMGRARAGGPVSTRPGRPCPLLLRSKVHFQIDIGIRHFFRPHQLSYSQVNACAPLSQWGGGKVGSRWSRNACSEGVHWVVAGGNPSITMGRSPNRFLVWHRIVWTVCLKNLRLSEHLAWLGIRKDLLKGYG